MKEKVYVVINVINCCDTRLLQVDFRQQLTDARSTSFERLKDSMNEFRWLEQRIYTMHCKLERLANENARFDHVCICMYVYVMGKC